MSYTGHNVVIVTEHGDDTMELEDLFAEKGFSILRSYDTGEIIDTLATEPVKAVFLQDFLQGLSGLEICRQIRQRDDLSGIPVYILSHDASKYSRRDITEAGADGVILRPFDKVEVWRRVHKKLESLAKERFFQGALASIDDLSSFGETILEILDPLKYDWLKSLDLIVGQILQERGKGILKPSRVLLGWQKEDGKWSWLVYEAPFGRLDREEMHLSHDEEIILSARGDRCSYFLNEGELSMSEMLPLTAFFERRYHIARNVVVYRSSRLCAFALNYDGPVSEVEALVLKSLGTQGRFLLSLSDQIQATEEAFNYFIDSLTRAAESNDDNTGNHILRVGRYAAFIADKLGLPELFIKTITVAARIHDVGKVRVNPQILRKPGSLSIAEWEMNMRHTLWGAEIIGMHPRLGMARQIALTHHEKWDGTGYPRGLKGESIPIEGRIVAMADAYDALRSPRAHKRSYQHKEVVWVLTKGDGRTSPDHFDPLILQLFQDNHKWFAQLYDEMGDEISLTGAVTFT